MQRGSQVVICCRCIGSLRNILIFGKKHKSYLVKAVLELGHVALEHSGAHEVGEEDGLEVSHLVPVNLLDMALLLGPTVGVNVIMQVTHSSFS